MVSHADDLTIEYEEGGVVLVKELEKAVLTKGAWATVLYRFQEWDRRKGGYGPEKYSLRRYQKRNGEYQQKSKFTISSRDQARAMIAVLEGWLDSGAV